MAQSATLSRPNSRLSGNGSQKSRSLVKRSIEVHDLNAADLLIERFTAWKSIVKQLISYFEGYASIQNSASREMVKLSAIIQVPFRSGNQFLGEGGLQVVSYTPFTSCLFLYPVRTSFTIFGTNPSKSLTSTQISVAPSTALSFSISRSSWSRSKLI